MHTMVETIEIERHPLQPFLPEGSICYIIGITKAIRQRIGKSFGDTVKVTLRTGINGK